jgi:monofunctional biosynthetic peptidoglycan transglycosylase
MFLDRFRRGAGRLAGSFGRGARALRWTLRIALVLLVADLFYLSLIWPDWQRLARGPVPKSNFIAEYERGAATAGERAPLRWLPVPIASTPKYLQRAAILAEDSRFYEHSGFDLIAFKEAMGRNIEEGRFQFGASTISQQTVKNLFLSGSRDPLRKWHELILTWGMEQHLSKTRILELYLNIAEFGSGVYGVQAAARFYWGVDVGEISPQQAAELTATLPSPIKHNPATRTESFEKRTRRIFGLLQRFPGEAAASLNAREVPPTAPSADPQSEPGQDEG